MFEPVQGQCTFETVEAIDLIDAASTLKPRRLRNRAIINVPPPGNGVDKLLNWAIAEVKASAQANNPDEQERFAASATTNARRALGCLVDWYMQRDCFSLCKNAPAGAERKSEILVRRGLIDELTSHVLARAIAKRDVLEHQFVAPVLETAEDVVELLRRTIRNLMSESLKLVHVFSGLCPTCSIP
jgi:hypothetical protein